MSFDQLPADPKNSVNPSERYTNSSQYHLADARYPINSIERNTNAAADGGTAWDPYELLSQGAKGAVSKAVVGDESYPINSIERNRNAAADGSTAWDPYEALTLGPLRKDYGKLVPDDGEDYKGGKELYKLGFPTPDLIGFDQEAPNHDGGLWHGLKHLFVSDETNGDKVREHVLKELSQNPGAQKQYDQEEKDLKAYHSKLVAWETQANMNPGDPPSPPDCPIHDAVTRRVQQEEKQIAAQVARSMSPQDRERLSKQMDEYNQACTDRYKDENPMGTGGGMRPLPQPGNAIKDYYDRIGEATERYCNS